MTQQRTALASTASPFARTQTLRTIDLLILSIGTFSLGVDGFVLSGLLPQVAASLHVPVSAAGQLTTVFALVYALAPVAVGLNGSAICIGSALGAGVGGVALAIGGRAAPTITAAIIGVPAVTIAAAIVPEQMTARKPAGTAQPPA